MFVNNFLHISRAHISKNKRCFHLTSSIYYFHMKTKIIAGVCYFKIIFFTNNYEVCRWVVIFQFYIWEPEITEYTFFYRNIISKNIETGTERVFSCYPRSPCSLSNYKYWESKTKSEIIISIHQY